MKKIAWFLIAFLTVTPFAARAQEGEEQSTLSRKEMEALERSVGKMVSLELSRLGSRVAQLERQVADFDRTERQLNERIRSVERTVDDLRRRRVE